jgi:hypothetical protein
VEDKSNENRPTTKGNLEGNLNKYPKKGKNTPVFVNSVTNAVVIEKSVIKRPLQGWKIKTA